MNTPDALSPQWPVPTIPPAHAPVLFTRAMRDMRPTWRARGILAELATGYIPSQEPTLSDLISLTRDACLAAEGRVAFRKAVGELRSFGSSRAPLRDAATGVGTYWSATGTGTCQGHRERADQVCSTSLAGAITGGGSNPSQLLATTSEYDWWGKPGKFTTRPDPPTGS